MVNRSQARGSDPGTDPGGRAGGGRDGEAGTGGGGDGEGMDPATPAPAAIPEWEVKMEDEAPLQDAEMGDEPPQLQDVT
jgi:hypothetical protein